MKRTLSGAAVLLTIIGILIASAFASPTMATAVRNIPVIGSIFKYMGDNGLKSAEKLNIVSTIRQSAKDKGIRITINNSLYDDARIVISFKEETKGEFKDFMGINSSILVNGKLAQGFGIGTTEKKVSEGVYVGLLTVDIVNSSDAGISNDPAFFSGKLPEKFTLGLDIKEMGGVKGNWNFNIPVSKAESKKMTVKFEPKISKTYQGVTHTLDEVIFAPSCVGLTFTTKPFGKSGIGSYKVYDDKGIRLEIICESIEKPLFLPINKVPKSLRIVPYTPDSQDLITSLTKQFPMTVSQGNLGDVTIQKVEFLTDKTIIYYSFKPKHSSAKPNPIRLLQKKALPNGGTSLFLAGYPIGPGKKVKTPQKTGKYSYVQEYDAIDPNKDLYVRTMQSIDAKPIKAYEMTVLLNNPVK